MRRGGQFGIQISEPVLQVSGDVVRNVDDAPPFLAADAAFAPVPDAPAADAPADVPADAPEAPAKRGPGRPPKGKA